MKKLILVVILLALVGGGYYFWKKHRVVKDETVYYRTQEIRRGSVTEEVTATGTVDPIQKVSVTTQVTGKIIALDADYNSRVTEGQVIAQIDPDTYESALASSRRRPRWSAPPRSSFIRRRNSRARRSWRSAA